MRKHFVLLLALVLCFTLLSGCSAKETSVPHSYADLTIRLPIDYFDLSSAAYAADYDFFYGSEPIIISGLRDEKTLFASFDLDLTLENYGRLVLYTNGLDCPLMQTEGIWNFTYESDDYTYLVTLWETENAFWTVQAYCPSEEYPGASSKMWEILASITV